jgi:hypothetical protein
MSDGTKKVEKWKEKKRNGELYKDLLRRRGYFVGTSYLIILLFEW